MITLGCLPISAKFNVFSQTHLNSYSPKIDVIIMNENLMHDKKIPQCPYHNFPFMNNKSFTLWFEGEIENLCMKFKSYHQIRFM